MLNSNARTKSSLSRDHRALVESLEEAVALPITAWSNDDLRLATQSLDAWRHVRVERDQPEEEPCQSVPLQALAKAVTTNQAAWAADASDSGWAFAATRLTPTSRIFVTCRVAAEQADRVARLLESVTTIHHLRAEEADLREENDSFAGQLASDLEELTFLRSMVDRLASTRVNEGFHGLATDTLPVLNATVRAECLVFYSLPNPHDPYSASVAASEGETTLTHGTLRELVRRFGPLATNQTLVRNWGSTDLPSTATYTQDDHPSGVRSLILSPLSSGDRVLGWLAAVNRRPTEEFDLTSSWQLASDEFGSGEGTLLATTASILATHAANLELFREKERLMVNTVRVLVSAIESKDKYTRGHSERVALYTRRIAEEIGYFDNELENIYLSALLHDVGKIGVPDAVLTKPGRLTKDEFDEIARHPEEGWAILSDLDQLRQVLPGVLYHHERWDGGGYPDGLKGDAIPLDGRVMAVADAFDAMTSNRPYRQGMPCEKAEAILRDGAGTQWDPRCVDAFFACLEDIRRIKDEYVETPRPERRLESTAQIGADTPASVG